MTDNLYEASQEANAHREPSRGYDPLAVSGRLTRIFWIVGFIAAFFMALTFILG
jgi:hypothetical protein